MGTHKPLRHSGYSGAYRRAGGQYVRDSKKICNFNLEMKTENIQRFKESVLLLCFLLFLFSFSNKGLAHASPNEKIPATIASLSKIPSAIVPLQSSFSKNHVSVISLPSFLSPLTVKKQLDSKTSQVLLSHLEKRFLSIKPQISSVFYYRLFSLSGELPG